MTNGAAHPRKATTFHLVFMTYSVICSGAYGLEEMISGSGPGIALLTLVVLPFVWAVPIALACAELSARYPVEGGYYRWARMAFGDFTGYMAGWLVWLANIATNGTFAVLFANYLKYWYPDLPSFWHWVVAAAVVWVTVLLNWWGIRLVGTTSVVLTVLIFFPFLGITLLGLAHFDHNPLVPFVNPERGPLSAFAAGLGIAIWLYSGFEKLTTNAGEVERPSRAFPIALAIAVPMAAGSYIIPTFAALAGHGHWSEWGESYFSVAAHALGGPALGAAMAAGGLVSSMCLLMVTTLGQSRLPMVLAEDGLFPRVFARRHPRFETPTVSLVVGGVALSLLVLVRFSYLAGMFSLVQVLAYLLIFAALLRLRSHAPRAESPPDALPEEAPFRIPLGTAGLALMTVPSLILSGMVIVESIWPAGVFDKRQALVDLLVFASGPLTYVLFRMTGRGPNMP
ncbi:MAG TPA: APC family permease [Candidatus Polarisedimenticolia bacterium]|nr:APC family permease [Candidatus Polarisedimenticolia bacterium]